MIDLHCHVLPGVDDGPASMQESVALCRAALAAGTTTIVATPHVAWGHEGTGPALIAQRCAELGEALRREGVGVRVLPGAEVSVGRAVELDDEELRALTLGGGPWLLVEPPFTAPAAAFAGLLDGLQRRGHRIVLAHPERIAGFRQDPSILRRLVAGGMLTAVTASALGGRFGRDVRRFAIALLGEGLVHAVASDAHDTASRPPGQADELRALGWDAHVEHLCRAVPAAVLAGERLPAAPPSRMRPATKVALWASRARSSRRR